VQTLPKSILSNFDIVDHPVKSGFIKVIQANPFAEKIPDLLNAFIEK